MAYSQVYRCQADYRKLREAQEVEERVNKIKTRRKFLKQVVSIFLIIVGLVLAIIAFPAIFVSLLLFALIGGTGVWIVHKGLLGVVLVAIGIWVAILYFPALPVLSLSLFVLIGGLGVFIGYKKEGLWILFFGLLLSSWGYAYAMGNVLGLGYFWDPPGSSLGLGFFIDFVFKVIPVVTLGTLPFAWFGRRKFGKGLVSRPARDTLLTWMVILLVIVPFVFAGMWDYNVRVDTSPPQVISMKVVRKYVNSESDYILEVVTQDRSFDLDLLTWQSIYDQYDIGSSIMVTVRKGALGYPWLGDYEP